MKEETRASPGVSSQDIMQSRRFVSWWFKILASGRSCAASTIAKNRIAELGRNSIQMATRGHA
jgi:hypothetical protein